MYLFAARLPFTKRLSFFVPERFFELFADLRRVREVPLRMLEAAGVRLLRDAVPRVDERLSERHTFCAAGVCWFTPCWTMGMFRLHLCCLL